MNAGTPETLTFFSKVDQGQFATGVILYRCVRSSIAKTFISDGRLIQSQQIQFRLYKADMDAAGCAEPKINDKVIDAAGVEYIVCGGVGKAMLGTVYILQDCQLIPS